MSCACGYEWPVEKKDPEPKHLSQALPTPILSSGATVERLEVKSITYRIWEKRSDPEAPRTMRVDYHIDLREHVSEWVCVEHDGFAGEKAYRWWATRSTSPMPNTADEAVRIARQGALTMPSAVTVKREPNKFDRIVSYELGDPTDWIDEKEKLREFGLRIVACVDDIEYQNAISSIADEIRDNDVMRLRVKEYLKALRDWILQGEEQQTAIEKAISGSPDYISIEEIPF
jgi:hypothetical protein